MQASIQKTIKNKAVSFFKFFIFVILSFCEYMACKAWARQRPVMCFAPKKTIPVRVHKGQMPFVPSCFGGECVQALSKWTVLPLFLDCAVP
jgi:hypothetical protein